MQVSEKLNNYGGKVKLKMRIEITHLYIVNIKINTRTRKQFGEDFISNIQPNNQSQCNQYLMIFVAIN